MESQSPFPRRPDVDLHCQQIHLSALSGSAWETESRNDVVDPMKNHALNNKKNTSLIGILYQQKPSFTLFFMIG